jgi:hypothetical protein
MFGTTCRKAMFSRERPAERAASTYSVLITCSVPERAILAIDGTARCLSRSSR